MNRFVKIFFLLYITILFFSGNANAQKTDIRLDPTYNSQHFNDFIQSVEKRNGIRIFYNPDSIPDIPVSIQSDSVNLSDALKEILKSYRMYISHDTDGNYFITKGQPVVTKISPDVYIRKQKNNDQQATSELKKDYITTKSEYVSETLVIGSENGKTRNGKARFSGIVKDETTGEPVIGANVYIEELKQGAATDADGHFELSLPKGSYTLQVSSIDKLRHKYNLVIRSDGSATLTLKPNLVVLEEVTVSSDKYNKVRSTQMGLEHITAKDVKNIPVVMGEKDILKVVQLLPGVQKAGEGASGFNVRGSPADQNLFYLNNIPVYNVNHLNGFFTAFHPEAISEVNLYKSNIPVEYGGRLASIFDISTRKGNMKKFGMHGGVSPISSNILFDNPLVKDKGSFMIGARYSYINWLLKKVKDPDIRNSKASFGDMLGSVNYDLGESDQIGIYGYYSNDKMNYNQLIDHTYNNQGASLIWNHQIHKKHRFTSSLAFSRYAFNETNRELAYNSFRYDYFIKQFEFRNILLLHLNDKHTLVTGFNNVFYDQAKGNFYNLQNDSVVHSSEPGNEKALESGIFVSDEWHPTEKLSVYAGLRYNIYNYLGPQDVYRYGSDNLIKTNITDTIHYGQNRIIKTYQKPDFRIAIKYQLLPGVSIKGSFNQLQQNIFMLSNTLSISPTDKWKLADYHIKPMTGTQYSLGVYYNSTNRMWEITTEGYYKTVDNFVEYKDGADLLNSEIIETEVLQGGLTAYGAELMLRKNKGKLTGWINYSYTHTQVLIKSDNPLKQVNNGLPYPSNYDKPHSVNFVSNYNFSRRFSLSCNVVYSTGRPFTSPISIYYLYDNPVINYSTRNELRIPDYFRVDLSANVEGNLVKKKLAHGSWMFSVYNLLGRKNAYSVYFTSENGKINGYKLSVFGTPIYTITYVFKLGNYND